MEIDKPVKLVSGERDELFAAEGYPKPFAFNREVAQVFDDMVSRSIPLYKEVTRTSAEWALRFYRPGTAIYDIGCSTGTTTAALAEAFLGAGTSAAFIGVDNSEPMIAKAQDKLAPWRSAHSIDLLATDIRQHKFQPTSVVIINYTLQFLPIAHRRSLLTSIRQALVPGGILFISDKVRGGCPEFHEAMTHIYEGFKQENGYSRTEIERKKEALEHVLVPLTFTEQMDLLADSGFTYNEPVVKWNNFLSTVSMVR